MGLNKMDLRILEIFEKLGMSRTFWSLGLTWSNELGRRLDGKVNFLACRKRLKFGLKFYLGSRSKCMMEGLIHGIGMLGAMNCCQRMVIGP